MLHGYFGGGDRRDLAGLAAQKIVIRHVHTFGGNVVGSETSKQAV